MNSHLESRRSTRVRYPEGDDPRRRWWWWWEALSQLPVSKLQFPANPALIPPPSPLLGIPLPTNSCPNLRYIRRELIPGNVYFDEQIGSLLLTQSANVEVGIAMGNSSVLVWLYILEQLSVCLPFQTSQQWTWYLLRHLTFWHSGANRIHPRETINNL